MQGRGSEEEERQGFPGGDRGFEGRSRSRDFEGTRGDQFGRGGRGHQGEPAGRGSGFGKQPLVSASAQGTTNTLISNHFKFGVRNAGYIYMYKIDFGPLMMFMYDRTTAIQQLKPDLTKLYGLHIGYGGNLFALQMVRDEITLNIDVNGTEHQIKIVYEAQFSLDDQDPDQKKHMDKILHFVMTVVKRTLLEQDYKQVGRLPRFFNADEKREITSDQLYMWPGYECSIKCFNDGIFLNVDTCTKFINKQTVLDKIYNLKRNRYSQAEIKEQLAPKDQQQRKLVVITMYNSKTYQIDDVNFDLNPKTYTFTWTYEDPVTRDTSSKQTNMIEYFLLKYKIRIEEADENQPLLVVNYKSVQIFLPCSLCHEAQLPKDFTKDSKRMRNLHQYKIQDPKERWERIGRIIEKLEIECRSFEDWNIKINPNFSQVKAKTLFQAKVLDQENRPRDFSDYERKLIQLSNPAILSNEKWALVYATDDFENANLLLEQLQKVSRELGMKVVDPQWVEIPNVRTGDDYCLAIESDIDPKFTEMVVVLIKQNTKPVVKKLLDKMGIPSQFVLSEGMHRIGQKLAVFTNILRQINAKMRLDVYRLQLPKLKNTMLVGVDLVNAGNRRIIGLCASYTKTQTQYLSKIAIQENPKSEPGAKISREEQEEKITQKRTLILVEFMKEALQVYQEENKGSLPEQIVVYRDGIGGPTLMEKCLHYEVKTIVQYFEQYAQNYSPKIIYCFVDRNVTHRLFQKINGDMYNPGPGTVVDSSLVESQGDQFFDFFMIPHKASVATARPVHFKVVYNTSGLTKDEIETTTYHLCYNYANFAGPIKVPSVCMYALKIAKYAHEYSITPNKNLSLNIHYI